MLHDGALGSSLVTSLEIAALTTGDHARADGPDRGLGAPAPAAPGAVVESVSVLPIVIPPIVMGAGLAELQQHAPASISSLLFSSPLTALTPFYVILALPFAYRSLDVGVRAIDLRTLVDAARSLGAGWTTLLAPRDPPQRAHGSADGGLADDRARARRGRDRRELLYDTYPSAGQQRPGARRRGGRALGALAR